jgi:hypothetical protein
MKGNMQGAGAIGVGVAQLDCAELVSFQFEQAVGQRLGCHVLAGEARVQNPPNHRGPYWASMCDRPWRGDDPGIGKAFEYLGGQRSSRRVRG